jgi:hypothetical protein
MSLPVFVHVLFQGCRLCRLLLADLGERRIFLGEGRGIDSGPIYEFGGDFSGGRCLGLHQSMRDISAAR